MNRLLVRMTSLYLWCHVACCMPYESELTNWVRLANATALGCEGQPLTLTCAGQEEGLKINSAFWGRDDLKTCLPSGHGVQLKLCPQTDPSYSKEKLRAVCDKKPFCILPVSDAFFDKPLCPNVSKFLKIIYDCRMMSGMGAR